MKILHIITLSDARGGGPIESARNLSRVWSKHGHIVNLLTLEPPGQEHPEGYFGQVIPIGRARSCNLSKMYLYTPNMVAWLKENAALYDFVIVSGLWRYHVRGALKGLKGGNVPYFVFTHGMLDPWFRKKYPLKHAIKQISWILNEGPLLRGAKNVMFTCEDEQVLAENSFWPYKVNGATVGYGTVDVEGDAGVQKARFEALFPDLRGKRFLLFLSRIHEKKGCDILLEAFIRYAKEDTSLHLVIAGPDEQGLVSKLKDMAMLGGVENRVHFPGMLRGDVKYGAFRSAEAFVLISHQENFGIVVAESLACGTPVLISDKVNIWREVIADGCGIVSSDTSEGAYDAISEFFRMNHPTRSDMRLRARATFEERYKMENFAARLLEFIGKRIGLDD